MTAADVREKYKVAPGVTDDALMADHKACRDLGEQKGLGWSVGGLATSWIVPPLGIALAITGVTVSHGTRDACMTERGYPKQE